MASSSPITEHKYGVLKTTMDNATKMMTVNWKMYPFQIQKFTSSSVGAAYHSDFFESEKNTKWQMNVYPNGWKEENAGSCLLYLRLKSMPESYGALMVYYNIRCNETGASFQGMMIHDKSLSCRWHNRTQLLSELCTLNQISFSCKFRILRINDKDGNPIYKYPLRISSVPQKEQFKWTVDQALIQQMAKATVGKRFAADGILSSSGLFSFELKPNECSDDTESDGKVKVYLNLCTLPIGVSALRVKYKILAPELEDVISATGTFNYDTQKWGGAMGKFQDLKATKTMEITAETEILAIFDVNGTKMQEVQFNADGMFPGHFGIWK